MNKRIVEIFGWYGVVAILVAYALVSFSVVSSSSLAYQLLNLSGAAGVFTVSIVKQNYQPAFLNLIWGAVALVALIRLVLT